MTSYTAILQHSPIMLDPATEEPTADKDSTPRTGEARDHTAAVYRAVHALGLLPSTVALALSNLVNQISLLAWSDVLMT